MKLKTLLLCNICLLPLPEKSRLNNMEMSENSLFPYIESQGLLSRFTKFDLTHLLEEA